MREYTYSPLQIGEIRLLHLNPMQHPSDDLSGILSHSKLTNPKWCAPKDVSAYLEPQSQAYEAISYHWGSDPTRPHRLLIHETNGSQSFIFITSTLENILRRLALTYKQRVLWADAICINQVNNPANAEKGEQIKLMPDIYRVATSVQVCLGPAATSDNIPAAIRLLSLISDYSEYLDDSSHEHGEEGIAMAQQNGLVLPPADDVSWTALRALFRRAWFRRVWIIQEFVYATDINIMCGDYEMDWRRLYFAAKAYLNSRFVLTMAQKVDLIGTKNLHLRQRAYEGAKAMHEIGDLRAKAWGFMSRLFIIENIVNDKHAWRGADKSQKQSMALSRNLGAMRSFEENELFRSSVLRNRAEGKAFQFGKPTFLTLIWRTRNFMATQHVDRLYALLGLASDAEDLSPIYSKEQTVDLVIKRFVISLLHKGNGSEILSTAGIRSHSPSAGDLPSWVPAWTTVSLANDFGIGFNRFSQASKPRSRGETGGGQTALPPQSQEEPETTPKPGFYNAALNTDMEMLIQQNQDVLTVRATAVDVVTFVPPGNMRLGIPIYASLVATNLGPQYMTGEPIEEALWRTMVANRNVIEKPPASFATEYENMKRRETARLAALVGIIYITGILAIPLVMVGIYRISLYIIAPCLGLLIARKTLPPLSAIGIFWFLTTSRWLPMFVLAPVLLALGWYLSQYKFTDEMLRLMAWIGSTPMAAVEPLPTDCIGFARAYLQNVDKYTFCLTRVDLMGLFPSLTQPGDIIVIIHGCDAPFVARETEQRGVFRLVGECYVHGIMDGEAMRMNLQTFELHLI